MIHKPTISTRAQNVNTAPDTTTDPLALATISNRDAAWDKHRGNTQGIGSIYDDGTKGRYKKLGVRMSLCANVLGFAQNANQETGEIGIKLRTAMFCKVRHCPVCQWRRGMRNVARFYERMPLVINAYPDAAWLFLTLTVKNPEMRELRSTLAAMNKAWKKMIERKGWPALGFIKTTEITKGKDGKPHPHFHVLLLVSPSYFQGGVYMSQAAWSETWQDCLKVDYLPVVHVQKVKAKSDKAKAAEAAGDSSAALAAAVAETLKYSVKPEDMLTDPAFLYGITDQLRKLRFLSTGGVLKDYLSDEVSDEEMIVTGDEESDKEKEMPEVPSLFFRWKTNEKRYKKVFEKT